MTDPPKGSNEPPPSLRARFRALTKEQRQKLVESLGPEEALALRYDSDLWLRDNQIIDGDDWRYMLVKAGRGFGKTKLGACWIKKCVERGSTALAICGVTHNEVYNVMVPAICAEFSPLDRPIPNKHSNTVEFPHTSRFAGVTIYVYTSDRDIRGPNIEKLWCDELGQWFNADERFNNGNIAVRLGKPQTLITTTPNRQTGTIRKLSLQAKEASSNVRLIEGSTFDNAANLSETYLQDLRDRYQGTRLWQQELLGELIDDSGALWSMQTINDHRVKKAPDLWKVVVSVDPAGSVNKDSDETGIIVAGQARDGYAYVLCDASGKHTPTAWARAAVNLYHQHHAAYIVAEKNFGGLMVEATIKSVDPSVRVKLVHASDGKRVRANPVAAKYAQGKVFHVGTFLRLEDQMTTFTGDDNGSKDDRLDALVWAITELLPNTSPVRRNLTYLPRF